MPTLYVENVPKDLYEALRARARKNRSSIAAEVIEMLKDTVPTAAELKRRRQFYDELMEIQAHKPSRQRPVSFDRRDDPRGP